LKLGADILADARGRTDVIMADSLGDQVETQKGIKSGAREADAEGVNKEDGRVS
jgi:hypothetical protein